MLVCLTLILWLVVAGCQKSGINLVSDFREANLRRELDRGDRLAAEQQFDEAALVYEDVLKSRPDHAGTHARLGRLYFQQGQYETASSKYRAALRSDPNCYHYALCLAQCQARLATTSADRDKKMDAAARAYQYAQSLDPQNFTATIQLAMCYRELGDFPMAVRTLKEAARAHPNAPVIHTQLGEVYHSQNDHDNALAEFKEALRIDPANVDAHNGCGMVNSALAQDGGARGAMARERAVAHFRRSLQINANQPQVKGMLEQFEPYQWKSVTVAESPSDQ